MTLLTDFRTNVQITRIIIAGEEELNEPRAQTLCFVSSFTNDLIPPEAGISYDFIIPITEQIFKISNQMRHKIFTCTVHKTQEDDFNTIKLYFSDETEAKESGNNTGG